MMCDEIVQSSPIKANVTRRRKNEVQQDQDLLRTNKQTIQKSREHIFCENDFTSFGDIL